MICIRKRIKDYWEGEAEVYCKTLPNKSTYKQIVSNMANVIIRQCNCCKRKMDILELGSGTGYLLCELSKYGNDVVGIDISKNMIDISRIIMKKSATSAMLIQMDAELLSFEDNSFDMIIGNNILWTLNHPLEAYKECYRVLKPGGKIFIFDANWNLWRFDRKLFEQYQQYQDYLFKNYKRGTHMYYDISEGEEIDKVLYLSNKKRPEWDIKAMTHVGYKNIYSWLDVSSMVWDKQTLEYNKKTLPFMVCGEK